MAQDYAIKVKPGQRVSLAKHDAGETKGISRAEGERLMLELDQELAELQELLYAAGKHSVLLLLQGMDTSGKDGAVKRVLQEVNPIGCHIRAFKAPTDAELAHDFLWRVHAEVPAKEELGVFNRSHYEDVLVVRVHELVPEEVWRKRYRQINDFERLLTESGTILIKCYLHISKEEQEERLLAREEEVTKAWKLAVGDWIERRSWDTYMAAYDDALSECSIEEAPWYIIPADKKWYRNLAIGTLLHDALQSFDLGWPSADFDVDHEKRRLLDEKAL